jgi:hypothetical protein
MPANRRYRLVQTVTFASVVLVFGPACSDDSGGKRPSVDAGEDGSSMAGSGGSSAGGGTGGRAGSGGGNATGGRSGSGGSGGAGTGGDDAGGSGGSGGGTGGDDAGAVDAGTDVAVEAGSEDAGVEGGGRDAEMDVSTDGGEMDASPEASFDAAPDAPTEDGAAQAACSQCLDEFCNVPIAAMQEQCPDDRCDDFLACLEADDCDETDPRTCYCGSVALTTCFASFDANVPQGPCKSEIEALLGATIPQQVAGLILAPSNPVGAIVQTAICTARDCAPQCIE